MSMISKKHVFEVFPSPCSNIFNIIMSVFNALSDFLLILWIIDGKIPKFLVIVGTKMLFLNCWTVYPLYFSQSGKAQPILTCGRPSFYGPIYPTITCKQLTC